MSISSNRNFTKVLDIVDRIGKGKTREGLEFDILCVYP